MIGPIFAFEIFEIQMSNQSFYVMKKLFITVLFIILTSATISAQQSDKVRYSEIKGNYNPKEYVPQPSWQIDRETMETVADFILLGSKITVEGDCSHEIKRCLLLGRKAMINLDRVLKSRDIALLTKVHTSKLRLAR